MTTRLAGEVPSPLACEDIPEAHKFHSGKVTEYSFPAGKVNDNWNHLKTNLGQRLALQFSTPVPCAAGRLRFFCNVTSSSMVTAETFRFEGGTENSLKEKSVI